MSDPDEHLAIAAMHTNELTIERQAHEQGDEVSMAALHADQGRALRLVIFHCLAAAVETQRYER